MENKTLKHIKIEDIIPNPNNPRLIFHEKDLEDLKESISNAGVLVPITVYEDEIEKEGEENEIRYILLDGERRWRSCKMLGWPTIPANIIDKPKDVTENILHMFNIHYFREQWELFPTALKLENIIELLKTDKDSVLSKTTGLNLTTVKRCKILLWYPQKYRETLLYKKDKISTDFFIELFPIVKRLNQEPEFNSDLEISQIIDGLISKFTQTSSFSDVKEFREMRKAIKYYDSKGQLYEFIGKLKEFIADPELPMDYFTILDLEIEKLKATVLKSISTLNQAFTDDNIELLSDYYVLDQIIALKEKLEEVIVKIQ
ncbi:MAG: ParB/RepB/Spo0J family partition protein [Flavobacteriaceae bacterium]|nr:ParB/RepB/Spo0J family partition protein [Flavobacteriaceae bacterium]